MLQVLEEVMRTKAQFSPFLTKKAELNVVVAEAGELQKLLDAGAQDRTRGNSGPFSDAEALSGLR